MTWRAIFVSRGRVRAGWRFLLFAVVNALLLAGLQAALQAIPATAPLVTRAADGTLSVSAVLILDALALAIVLGTTALAARLERRPLAAFGFPVREMFGPRFWQGVLAGLMLATSDIAVTWLLGGISFEPSSLAVSDLALHAAAWAAAFVLVGLVEELLYRGYALATLAAAIGFWPAAATLALAFGGLHLLNGGETVVGALNVVLYALFASFTLRRTGNLWFAIGIHTAWDYAQSFLYGVPDSGMRASGQLVQAHLHGPTWLTGGSVGPEGSAIGFAVLGLAFLVLWWRLPARPADPPRVSRPG
ncbi:MAG TPA: type II CAAX endopeptidase family protein [Kofleriaceae bacterium]|jgi:hypothetical protein|nr:type II CAAX endopeptidase family protein [Kofleriaceae bacterium]